MDKSRKMSLFSLILHGVRINMDKWQGGPA
jgi:hypothetical protein